MDILNKTSKKIVISLSGAIGNLELLPGLNQDVNPKQWDVAKAHPLTKRDYLDTGKIIEAKSLSESKVNGDTVVDVEDQPRMVTKRGKPKM